MKLALGLFALFVALCLSGTVLASCSTPVCPTCPCPDCRVITVVKEVPGGNTVQLVPTEVPVTDVQVVISEVPVDRVVQVTKEVPVEKIVYKDRVVTQPGGSTGEVKYTGRKTGLFTKNTVGQGENILEIWYTACDVVETDCVTGLAVRAQRVQLWLYNKGPDQVSAGGLTFAISNQSVRSPERLLIYPGGVYPLALNEMWAGSLPYLAHGGLDKTAQIHILPFNGNSTVSMSAAEIRAIGGWIIQQATEQALPEGESMLSANEELAAIGRV